MIKRSKRIKINGRSEGPGGRYDFGEPEYIEKIRRHTPNLIISPLGTKLCAGCKQRKPTKGGSGGRGKPFLCIDCKPTNKSTAA
jgi:hypothetical protein